MQACNHVTDQNAKKRKLDHPLHLAQQELIQKKIGVDRLENTNVVTYKSYKINRMSNTGQTKYQSGKTLPNNFQKSSSFVFVEDESLYGEINLIMEHYQGTQRYIWFEVNLFEGHEIDDETRLPFALLKQTRRKCIVDENSLSEPLIVGIDEPYIWFISISHMSDFPWLEGHIG